MDANSSFVPSDTFSKTLLHDLYTYQGEVPRDVVADQAVVSANGMPPHPFTFLLECAAPTRETKGGEVRVADSNNFTVSKTIAAALLTIGQGGLREMHLHPNADEWQYWIKEKGQMIVFNTGPKGPDCPCRSWSVAGLTSPHYLDVVSYAHALVVQVKVKADRT
jgi:oxalate decarboxylase